MVCKGKKGTRRSRDLQKKSRDFWTSLVPGPQDHGTFRVSRSCPARTTGPSKSLGPVLSRPVPGPSRDFPGRDSPAGKPNRYHKELWELYASQSENIRVFATPFTLSTSGVSNWSWSLCTALVPITWATLSSKSNVSNSPFSQAIACECVCNACQQNVV